MDGVGSDGSVLIVDAVVSVSADSKDPVYCSADPGEAPENGYPAGDSSRDMDEYTAVFEIDSVSDAYAVERLMNGLYDSVREESRTLRDGANDSTEMLEQFKAIRDAVQIPKPGKLTVTYEFRDEEFEG